MNLQLVRKEFTEQSTIGELTVDGQFECFTLEDKVRPDGVKVFGETAIPEGIYHIDITFSNRFKKDLPLLLAVPNFEGVRIHSGNTPADTLGCILVGKGKGSNRIDQSRDAFNALFPKLRAAKDRGDGITLEISGQP